MVHKLDYIPLNSRLLQGVLILLAGIMVFLLGYQRDVHAENCIVAIVGVVFLAYIGWSISRLLHHLRSSARELTDTRQHLEERVLQRTREQEMLVHELKNEIATRRKFEDALTGLRKEEDVRQRKKLAAELHDIIGQNLQSIKLLFTTQQAAIKSGDIPTLESQEQLVDEINLAIEHIRQMTSELHPIFLDSMDILEAIYSHNYKVQERVSLDIEIDHDQYHYKLEDLVKEYCFLIYREVLNNIIKHAAATRVKVKLGQCKAKWFHIEIKDNGTGFDPESIEDRGHGLVLMQDRTRDIGGSIDIKSMPGEGTTIYFKIPIND